MRIINKPVNDADVILILRDALEDIRKLTAEPYINGKQRPSTLNEKLDAWANIQAIAARALRETDVENAG